MILANYCTASSAIDRLCDPTPPKRILFLRGETGFGKTSVIRAALARNSAKYVALQISADCDVGEFIFRTRKTIGDMPAVTAQLRDTGSPLTVQTARNFLVGWRNQINVVVNRGAEHVSGLTQALFSDLASVGEPVIYAMDDFDQSSPSFEDFVCRRFLPYVGFSPPVRVVIAGQTIPDPNNIEWADHCEPIFDLKGVAKPEDWIPVVLAMKRKVKDRSLGDYLAGACDIVSGRPDRMMQLIEGLPKDTA
jgi:hypothetical protein